MALLTPTLAKLIGQAITPITPNVGGDTIPAGDRLILLALNSSGGALPIVIAVPGNTPYGQAQPDVTVSVPATSQRVIGPFPPGLRDDADNLIHLTYTSGVTGLSLYLIQV